MVTGLVLFIKRKKVESIEYGLLICCSCYTGLLCMLSLSLDTMSLIDMNQQSASVAMC